jgi:hypothetical protein
MLLWVVLRRVADVLLSLVALLVAGVVTLELCVILDLPLKWRRHVADVVARLITALQPDDTVIGGGNVKRLEALPPRTRQGDNANAFRGGFRLWAKGSVIPADLPPGRAHSARRTRTTGTLSPMTS